jgi:transcriptional/translational regulatory protein YebC/TACO1
MLEAAIEAGAENVESGPGGHEVTCGPDDLFAVQSGLAARFGEPEEAKLEWRPTTTAAVDEEQAASLLKLIDALEDHDDVQTVFANFEVSDAVLAKLSA